MLVLIPAIGIADDHDSLKLPEAAVAQNTTAAVTSDEGAAKPANGSSPVPAADNEPAQPTNPQVPPPPKTGSHIAADDNSCIQCHGETDLWDEKSRQLFISKDKLAKDVHWQKGVNCADCHGGDSKSQEPRERTCHGKRFSFQAGGNKKILFLLPRRRRHWNSSKACTTKPDQKTNAVRELCCHAINVMEIIRI